jgi:hypothetical protein
MQRARDAAAGVLDSCSLAELVQAPKHQVTFPSRVRRNGSRPLL